jgi:hypothetical protein
MVDVRLFAAHARASRPGHPRQRAHRQWPDRAQGEGNASCERQPDGPPADNAGAAVGPATSGQIIVTVPVTIQVAPAIVRFNWQVSAVRTGKFMPNGKLTLSLHPV